MSTTRLKKFASRGQFYRAVDELLQLSPHLVSLERDVGREAVMKLMFGGHALTLTDWALRGDKANRATLLVWAQDTRREMQERQTYGDNMVFIGGALVLSSFPVAVLSASELVLNVLGLSGVAPYS